MRETWFHEDDYCQVELLPLANEDFCRRQLAEIQSFSARHRSEFGWTEMYVRKAAPVTLAAAQIPSRDVCFELEQYLTRFDRVCSGYSTYRKEFPDTIAFGFDKKFMLYGECQGEYLVRLWLIIQSLSAHENQLAMRTLEFVAYWQLLLVDWPMSALIALADTEALNRYLEEFRSRDTP